MVALIHQAILQGDLLSVQSLVKDNPALIEERTDEEVRLGKEDLFLHGERGGAVEAVASVKSTPLMLAVMKGDEMMIRWLVTYGAKVDAQDEMGLDVLSYACSYASSNIVGLLLDTGLFWPAHPPHHQQFFKKEQLASCLMNAVMYNNQSVCQYLLHHYSTDLDMNRPRYDGMGPLHWACLLGRTGCMEHLLAAGADPYLMDDQGARPMDVARAGEHSECVELLEAAVAELQRVRLLHQARLLADDTYHIHQTYQEAKDETPETRNKKCAAAAPAYLKERVEKGEELPVVSMSEDQDDDTKHEEEGEQDNDGVTRAVFEHVVMDGQLAKELFMGVMEYMVQKWDAERRRD